ncbi:MULTISPECIES: hypothetical protein [Pantoea]|uniref:hypothetical protein n=1 Tax=Pantoea TaxID=53335 RepID=UPI001912DA76|nr:MULTISPECIES: hypothetical protein [Pantoea]
MKLWMMLTSHRNAKKRILPPFWQFLKASMAYASGAMMEPYWPGRLSVCISRDTAGF